VDFVDEPGDAIDWDNTTLLVTADHANSYLRLITPLGPGDLPTQVPSANPEFVWEYPDGDVVYPHTLVTSGIEGEPPTPYRTQHTSELVTLRARGRAASHIQDYAITYPGLPIVDNTAIHGLTLDTIER
jgi:alkaline phosphatase